MVRVEKGLFLNWLSRGEMRKHCGMARHQSNGYCKVRSFCIPVLNVKNNHELRKGTGSMKVTPFRNFHDMMH